MPERRFLPAQPGEKTKQRKNLNGHSTISAAALLSLDKMEDKASSSSFIP